MPQAMLAVGYAADEFERLRELLIDLEADIIKVLPYAGLTVHVPLKGPCSSPGCTRAQTRENILAHTKTCMPRSWVCKRWEGNCTALPVLGSSCCSHAHAASQPAFVAAAGAVQQSHAGWHARGGVELSAWQA